MIAAQYISLVELQRRVRQSLEERFALPLWVSAEIAEIKVNYSGHCYLELVEKGEGDGVLKAQARAVIWRSQYARIAAYFVFLPRRRSTTMKFMGFRCNCLTSIPPTRWAIWSGSGSRPSPACRPKGCGR